MANRTGVNFQVTRQAMEILTAYDWPGNVRELENAIERACVLCENNIIHPADLPPALLSTPAAERILASASSDTATAPAEISREAIFPLGATDVQSARMPREAPAFNGPLEPLKNFIREQELMYLHRALAQVGGDKEKAADLLGISLATLYRKLAEPQPA
jgi:DNA-binding NtrC family response regulator